MYEDIFNVNNPNEHPHKFVIRYNEKAASRFDSNNQVKFEELLRILSEGDWPCFLSKRTPDEYLISIPMKSPSGQADLVVSYNTTNFCYDLKVSHAKKTKFRASLLLPDSNYSLPVTAQFVFLTRKEAFPDLRVLNDMQEFKEKVDGLEIPPGMSIEIQHEIWTQYIEAQSQIIDDLNEPFIIEGEPRLSEEKMNNGEGIFRYRFDLRLPARDMNEYSPLKKELNETLQIEIDIDNDGYSMLPLNDIYRGLDPIIRKIFNFFL